MDKSNSNFYSSVYAAAPSWTHATAERRGWVYKSIKGRSVKSVLDIGCGRGVNTLWLSGCGTSWLGVDIVDAEKLQLDVPDNGAFIVGDVRDSIWVASSPFMSESYDLVVDQGSILVSLDDAEERLSYIQLLEKLVKSGGLLVLLVLAGEEPAIFFPDGRTRTFSTSESLARELPGFEMIETSVSDYEVGDPRNPLARPLSVLHATLQRK